MALRFPFERKRRAVDSDGQPLAVADDVIPETAPPPAYPTIDPNYVPAPPDSATPEPIAAAAPDVDPAVFAAVRQTRIPAPAPIVAAAPAPAPVEDPLVSRSGQVMDENATRSRRVESDKHGRPISNPTIADRDERLNDLANRVDDYVPQKAPKWQRYLKIAAGVGAMFAGAAGHDSRAVAGANQATLANAMNPKLADEMWKRGQQEAIGAQVDETRKRDVSKAEVEYKRAQAKKLSEPEVKPRHMQLVKNDKGTYVAVDVDTGLDQSGSPVQGGTPAEDDWTLKEDESGTLVPVNKKTGLGQDGKPVKGKSMVQLEDGTWIDATSKYATDRQFGTQDRTLDIENQKALQENARVQGNIDSARRERDGLGEALKTTPQMVTRTRANPVTGAEENYQIENPVYNDYMTRYRQLDDQIKTLNGQLKPIVKAPPRPSGGGRTYKVDSKFLK